MRPFLRRLGLAAEPEDQRQFLFAGLVDALTRVGPRVLISASADEAMAAMVVEAGVEARRRPAITVLDRCGTPLLVNSAFGRSAGADLSTAKADALAFRPPEPFDAIATHSFFGSIAPADRRRLITKWHEVLRPGGRVITVVRLRPAGEARAFSADDAELLAAEVRRRATERAKEIGLAPEDLASAALRYARERLASHPVHSIDEVVGLFEDAGFRMIHADERATAGRVSGIEGPALPRGGRYAELLAERD